MHMKIGFIGLGHMGSVMAQNLVMAGHDVTVFNRTPGKTGALVQLGAHAATDIAGACDGQVAITMLADDLAVEGLAMAGDGIIATLPKSAIHLSMGSEPYAMWIVSNRTRAPYVPATGPLRSCHRAHRRQ
jgi:3-hydroxyisobutyrate dehydrogenase-like beta-hydroxyacid dehydrogenase